MDDPQTRIIIDRYARRNDGDRYSLLRPEVWHSVQERQRAFLRLLARLGWHDVAQKSAFEVGCGAGANLLELLRTGFAPQHLGGVDLLPERLAKARAVLPPAVQLHADDATALELPALSQDLVLQATVFSSLLDGAFQSRLARKMWSWVRPGGGVLWYDLAMDNPRNPDVKGIPLRRVRELFPEARLHAQRLTLAPPISRAVCRIHPSLYPVFNCLPLLRTHHFAWLQKLPV